MEENTTDWHAHRLYVVETLKRIDTTTKDLQTKVGNLEVSTTKTATKTSILWTLVITGIGKVLGHVTSTT